MHLQKTSNETDIISEVGNCKYEAVVSCSMTDISKICCRKTTTVVSNVPKWDISSLLHLDVKYRNVIGRNGLT